MSLESDIKSLVESVDAKLYDTSIVSENGETIYRVSIIANSGKTDMEKCVELTHLISPLLDVTPPVSGEYRLEVGSPGIERKLASVEHFAMSIGEKASLVLADKEKVRGPITKVEGSKIFLDVEGEEKEIDYADIIKAKTYFEW